MKIKFKCLRYTLLFLLIKKLRINFQVKSDDYVLSRVACMGKDIIEILNLDLKIFNTQKGRVDLLYKFMNNDKLKPQVGYIAKFINRSDIITLIEEQYLFNWKKTIKPPKYIFIDSYSELTDQLFVHNSKKWMFCSNYSDINHSKEFNDKFNTVGLLELEQIKEQYQIFFKELRSKFPSTPIFFLHFPTKLDKREKFKERYKIIKNSIEDIKGMYEPFYSISIDENIIDWPRVDGNDNSDNFPYHFNQETYIAFASKIQKILS